MDIEPEKQPIDPSDPSPVQQSALNWGAQDRYQAFLLRLWWVGNDDQEQPTWRLMLEEVHSHQRHHFATLIELNRFLRTLMRK